MLICYWLLSAQIVGESFPISSSSHVALIELFLVRYGYLVNGHQHMSEAVEFFAHGPTVLIVALFFYDRWLPLLLHLRRCWRIVANIIGRIFVADCITAGFFLFFKMFPPPRSLLGIGLCITALSLYSLRFCRTIEHAGWTWPRVVLLGIAQGCALLPGISRMAFTYAAARWLRLAPRKSFEISLLMQWPLIAAAFVKGAYELADIPAWCSCLNLTMALVILGSMGVAWCGLRFVYACVVHEKVWWFAYYMVVPLIAWVYLC